MRASTRPRAERSEPNRARKGNGNRRRGNANPSLAIRGDREIYCSWLSVRPAPARRRRCDWGFWLEQAHADQPAVLVDALYDVSVQLELGYDGRLIGVRPLQPEPRTRSPPGSGARVDSQRPCIPRSRLVRAQAARRGEGAPVHHHRSRGAVERQWSPVPLRVRGLGRLGCTPSGRSAASSPARSTGAGRAARRVTSTLTNPMTKLRRAVERRLAYAPRFLRHYQHRRQIGCTPAVAFRSARERMRQPHP